MIILTFDRIKERIFIIRHWFFIYLIKVDTFSK